MVAKHCKAEVKERINNNNNNTDIIMNIMSNPNIYSYHYEYNVKPKHLLISL